MRKDILTKKLARLQKKAADMKARALASEDVNEVRSITADLEDVNAEIAETQEELAAIEAEERSANQKPDDAELVNGKKVFEGGQKRELQPTETLEYRQAFMRYVQTGNAEIRAGEVITTADTGAAIPLTVMNEVINTVRKRYGNLYNKVRKLSVKGGVQFSAGALQANFKWISESTVSPRQKLNALAKISFSYHVAEIRIAQSFLASIVTLDAFEAEIARVIAIAYLQAMDTAIVKGTGDGMPLGILNDARVTHNVTMTAAKMSNWPEWRKTFFAALPLGYRSGEFIFPLSTVEKYLETMADSNNNPIFRQATGLEVNDGDAVNPNGRFFGREISIVEPDILPDFDTASANDVIGIYWQPDEYAINENFGFTMRRYYDEETNEWVDKALVVVDGKLLNAEGVYLIKKGS